MHQLERQGADIRSKIEELEELNQSFRERDNMKDDAIAHLSDQLMALTVRMQESREKTTVTTAPSLLFVKQTYRRILDHHQGMVQNIY